MLALTSIFHGEGKSPAAIREALEKIARAGFSHILWHHEWGGPYLYSIHEMLQIREWLEELGLKVRSVHASSGPDTKSYYSFNEYNRLAGVELVKNRVELAHILGADNIVLHFHQFFAEFEKDPEYRKKFYARAFKSFDELEPFCRVRHIRICVENLSGPPPAWTNAMFDDLFARYDADFMGLCFDTGHANIACKENCLEYAERHNSRLFMIHAHDNHSSTGDEHLIPFEGTFNWEGFAPVLARSPYGLPVAMESAAAKEEADDGLWLEKARKAGERFYGMVMKHRGSPGKP